MKAKDVVVIWKAPKPPKLMPKQISVRLPILVAAKISALCDLYPGKTKNEIIYDLVTVALEQIENELPMTVGEMLGPDKETNEVMYEAEGIRPDYYRLTDKYLREIEKEAGIAEPTEFEVKYVFPQSEFKY
jgi:hypothetical protein